MSVFGLVRGVSFVHQRTEVTASRAKDIDLADVQSQLGAVNDTYDKVSGIVDQINGTIYDMLETFLSSTSAFDEILATLQKAADAASMLPGGDSISTAASDFISTANSSLQKAQGDLPDIVNEVESKVSAILPEIQETVNSVLSEFLDAAQDVMTLQNVTDASLVKKARNSKHAEKAEKQSKHADKA